MESALSQLRQLACIADESLRRRLMVSLHELANSMETSNDTIHRYGYLHLQTAAVKIGFDLGLFKYLTKAGSAVDVSQIASHTGADVHFTRRYLRYLASIGAVYEVGEDHYSGNKVSENLAEPVTEAGVSHCFVTIGPQYQALPSFLQQTGYRNPNDPLHTVFQAAWNTPLHAFAWYKDHADELRFFNDYMALRRQPELSWLILYPVLQESKGLNDHSRALYVNMGGGIGHQCAQFRRKYPDIPGRVILQDLEHSILNALPTPGVENMVHNFFDPQPVKNAKFYYVRGVLHNHPDQKVRQVLKNIKQAMAPDSVLLLDEMVLPQTGTHAYAASMDLTMMSAFASAERTEKQWRNIVEDVGLVFTQMYTYNPTSYESVMDIRLPSVG
ncbi:O-methyl transferase B [Apiospora aurea]|uniref:O-methyl transferase B n=1 Tax=Apiospora aurea TaxID=335848 RepID=A0ABR1Q2L6_9PEZI